jgi:TATA-box binding protein (TBP) (component of TFIID and TFIIIB)
MSTISISADEAHRIKIGDSARAHDAGMRRGIAEIRRTRRNVFRHRPYVTTMTVGVYTTFKTTNLNTLKEGIANTSILCDATPSHKLRCFRNCVIIKVNGYPCNVTTKIFTNGFIHITGCKNMAMALSAADRITMALEFMFDVDAKIQRASVQMVNTSFVFKRHISMDRAFPLIVQALASTPLVNVYYNKSVHAAIKITVKSPTDPKRKITGLIFRSGSVIFTGIQTPEEFKKGMNILVDAYVALPDATTSVPVKRGGKCEAIEATKFDDIFEEMVNAL